MVSVLWTSFLESLPCYLIGLWLISGQSKSHFTKTQQNEWHFITPSVQDPINIAGRPLVSITLVKNRWTKSSRKASQYYLVQLQLFHEQSLSFLCRFLARYSDKIKVCRIRQPAKCQIGSQFAKPFSFAVVEDKIFFFKGYNKVRIIKYQTYQLNQVTYDRQAKLLCRSKPFNRR